jgi:hypothetical protein
MRAFFCLCLISTVACAGHGFSFEKFTLADRPLSPPSPPAPFDPSQPLNQDRKASQASREAETAARLAKARFKLTLTDGTLLFAHTLHNEANMYSLKNAKGDFIRLSTDQVAFVVELAND